MLPSPQRHPPCRTLSSLNSATWLRAAELRIGLGCMRLPDGGDPEQALAADTIAAAVESGIVLFDTAHAYGPDPAIPGENERLVTTALRRCGADGRARIITKGGMTRAGEQWIPDGRARTIRADCEASLVALGGLAIDLYLVHAPDPRTPWRTTMRALAELKREGLVSHVGVSNVNRRQLEEAIDVVEIDAIQVALSVLDDTAVRGGLVDLCEQRRIALIAHSPLGGPRRSGALVRREALVAVARDRGVAPQEVALAWVLDVSPVVVAIPGARREATARSAARAGAFDLAPSDRERLISGFAWPQKRSAEASGDDGEVVMVMGIPGSGKTRHAEEYTARGYLRLNRDARGGSLRELNTALDEALEAGSRRIVLDNTYLTRATRSHVLEVAARHHRKVRCVWVDTPLAQAQVNLVERLLDRFGGLPDSATLRLAARSEPGILLPTNQMRAYRELEPPSADEGFASVKQIPFVRAAAPTPTVDAKAGAFVAVSAMSVPGWEAAVAGITAGVPCLLFDWEPNARVSALDADAARLSDVLHARVTTALCPHAAGPPVCWCRPPLPGLILAFARTHGIDVSRSTLIGSGPAHRTLAKTVGATYVAV
jgi:aryl-alcohol dehydrogenase-like predicted oxidoreductase